MYVRSTGKYYVKKIFALGELKKVKTGGKYWGQGEIITKTSDIFKRKSTFKNSN